MIDPQTNEIVAEVPVGIQPGPIAAGAGSVWVGNLQDRTLTKIDPAAALGDGTISLENRTPTGIAVGLGAVWVAHGLRGDVSRVDPQFGQVTGVTLGGWNGVRLSVRQRRGRCRLGVGRVRRLDARAARRGRESPGTRPGRIAAGGRRCRRRLRLGDELRRRDRAAVQRRDVRARARSGTFNVGRAPDGDRLRGRTRSGSRAPATTSSRESTPARARRCTIPVGDGPSALAGGSGSVWVANTAAGTVSRIDPRTNDVVATIDVGNAPAGIAPRTASSGSPSRRRDARYSRQTAVRSSTGRRTMQPTRRETSVGSLSTSTAAIGAASRASSDVERRVGALAPDCPAGAGPPVASAGRTRSRRSGRSSWPRRTVGRRAG